MFILESHCSHFKCNPSYQFHSSLDVGFSEVETTIASSLLFIFPNQYHALRLAFQHCLAFPIGLEHSWQQLSSSLSPPFYSVLPSSSLKPLPHTNRRERHLRVLFKILHFQVSACWLFTALSRLYSVFWFNHRHVFVSSCLPDAKQAFWWLCQSVIVRMLI